MPIFESLNLQARERPPLHCRIYETYLPPSYLPESCSQYYQFEDGIYYYPKWAWSLINTVFVSTATLINSVFIMIGLFLWMANRQFHFSKKKHSYDKEPLRPLKPLNKAKKSSMKALKKAKRSIINKVRKKRGIIIVEDDEKQVPVQFEKVTQNNMHRVKSFSSFLEDLDEDKDTESTETGQHLRRARSDSMKKGTHDLLQLASRIEVFSYLSLEAAEEILSYVEYVDLSSEPNGKLIFDNNTLDGSLYAVISGEATMTLSVQKQDTGVSGESQSFDFLAGPGEVLTSLLTLISSLIREYQLQEAFVSSPIPGLIGSDFINVDVNGKPTGSADKRSLIPEGFNVRAIVSAPNTRLMRIPSRCFISILERFPQDVHQICQTIVARLQRVTIQTLVRFLGLDAEVLGTRANRGYSSDGKLPERKPRKTSEWKKFEESLEVDSNSSSLIDRAIPAAASLIGLAPQKSNLLKEGASIVSFSPGCTVCKPGEVPGAVYLILKGYLEVGYEKDAKAEKAPTATDKQIKTGRKGQHNSHESKKSGNALFSAGSGTFVGLFSSFTNDSSFIHVRNSATSSTDALLLKISSKTFEKITSTYPRALIHCLLDILDTIGSSPSVYLLDWTLDWIHVDAGEHIALKDQPCESMFVVLNGRLRTSASPATKDSGNLPPSLEYGRGETLGGFEALADDRWPQDVFAIRHCEVARVPISLISVLMTLYPTAGVHFAKVIAKMHKQNKSLNATESLLPSYGLSIATIAVIPLALDIDSISDFCSSLTSSLEGLAPTKWLTKEETIQKIGRSLLRRPSALLKMKMTRFLGDLEENNRLVVYQGELKYTWWNKLAIQQADCVLVVVNSNSDLLGSSQVQDCLEWASAVKNVRIELVVVQSHASSKSGEHASKEVNDWNENMPWLTRQHLVRSPFKDHLQDFSRLCRRVTGQSVGLVLGGGGARGFAHIGVIKALTEAGLSVDMVGGTSQGAFVGALFAKNPDDFEQLEQTAREMADSMSSMKEKLLDLTFPVTSFFNGSRFNNGISKFLGDVRIQDLVLNFYCVSVDIRRSQQMIHRKGVCWKAVRASMTLAGYLPPVSVDGALCVDGGYMNVLPADIMKESGAKMVIAVDVSYEKIEDYFEYGMELSGWWLIWNSWNPFTKTVRVPSMGDINERLAWISSERYKKHVVENKIDLFLRPPVDDYGTLAFDKYDEIVKIGYDYAKPLVEQWAKDHGYFKKQDK